jgi:tRNA threonylcarbamoyladenosine biosynthesis protein TsaE
MKVIIHQIADWDRLAKQLAERLPSNAVLTLSGPLGAGKTTLVQALAREFGATENPRSPTFSLVRSYKLANTARFKTLVHVDAYRLEHEADAIALGLDELAAEEGSLLVVEWPERLGATLLSLRKPIVQLTISQDPGTELRRVEVTE